MIFKGYAPTESTAPGGLAPDGTPLPRVVRHPELLDAEPLPLLGDRWLWSLGTFLAAIALFLVVSWWRSTVNWPFSLALVGPWLLFAAIAWTDRRAHLQTEGSELVVRSRCRTHRVEGRTVRRVVHQFNGKRPDFQLVTDRGKVWVPTSRLQRGHTTFFTWLDVHAPQAVLDRESTHWRWVLLADELI